MPPRLAERLLSGLLGDAPSTPFVIGDLREEYRAMRSRRSALASDAWYIAAALRLGMRVRWESRRSLHADVDATPSRHTPGDQVRTELRQALRFLRRRPAFSGAIVLTVALAISATTLAFAVVDGVLLEPLPYAQPDRLVAIWETNPRGTNDRNVVSPANYITWSEELRSFDGVASLVEYSTTMIVDGEPERVGAVSASATYFDVVGARPLAGRLYRNDEDVDGGPAVVVLSEGFWRRRFGSDPSVVGRALTMGDTSITVIGILPERFDFDLEWSFGGVGSHDVWFPPQFPAETRQRGGRYLQVVARLAPSSTVAAARSEATALALRLQSEFPERQTGWGVNVIPLRADLVGDVRTTILIVFGAVCFVLLIACANVANLLMTRATERQQEMAVRSALGAGRGRLVRQLLAESVILSTLGGALGVLLAGWGLRSMIAAAPDIPRLETIGLDFTVVGFALLATFATGLMFGLAPALHIAGADVAGWLKERGTGGRLGARRLRGVLVVAQVALSLMLLIGAGLLVRSLANRMAVGVGFDVDGLITAEIQVPSRRYDTPEAQAVFFEQLVERVSGLAGVRQASAITFPPLSGGGTRTTIWPMDRPAPEPGREPGADIRWVHHGYHGTMGIPLLAGRYFDERDRAGTPLAVLINETGATQLWPGEDAVGKRIAMPWNDTLRAEVIGVVADVRSNGPDTEPYPMLYWDHRQFRSFQQMTLVVRTDRAPSELLPSVRAVVRDLDPELPLYNVATMDDLFAKSIARARFTTASMGLFALLALILAGIGTYAVMAYSTQQRTQEIGIRIALGANRASVTRMVVGQGMIQIAIAVSIGTAGALALSRSLQSLMFEVTTTDPLTFVAMAILLGSTGVLAAWLPARKASGIDPVAAIRAE